MNVQERYAPIPAAANATIDLPGSGLAGFICVTSGTISVYDINNVAVVNAFPVTAGTVYGLPIFLGIGSQFPSRIVLAGGASGTVLEQ